MFGIGFVKDTIKLMQRDIDTLYRRIRELQAARNTDAERFQKFEQGVDDQFEAQEAAWLPHHNAIDAALANLATSHANLVSNASTRIEALVARVGLLEARESNALIEARREMNVAIARVYRSGHFTQDEVALMFGITIWHVRKALRVVGTEAE